MYPVKIMLPPIGRQSPRQGLLVTGPFMFRPAPANVPTSGSTVEIPHSAVQMALTIRMACAFVIFQTRRSGAFSVSSASSAGRDQKADAPDHVPARIRPRQSLRFRPKAPATCGAPAPPSIEMGSAMLVIIAFMSMNTLAVFA